MVSHELQKEIMKGKLSI